MPYNQSRLDCLIFGKSKDDISNVVLIELKQWSDVKALAEEGNFVGCIYTAQGFEFDYIGVIIGNDLCVDKNTGKIAADITATKDPMLRRNAENFEKHVKNIYRTLLTRGMKGCYVYFTNKEAEKYFRSRMEV